MKRLLALALLMMFAFLLSACVIDATTTSSVTTTSSTTTTSTTTVPQSLTRFDVIDVLDRYAEAIASLTAYYPEGDPFPDDVASMTFLRSELTPMPAAKGLSWMGDTWDVATTLSTTLDGCDPSTDPTVCHRLTDGVQSHIRFAVSDGWLKIESLTVQTFLIESTVHKVLTYEGLELNLISDDIAFRHLTIGPVEESLDQSESVSQAVYQESGEYEYWRYTPTALSKNTHNAATDVTTYVSLNPLNRLYVRKFFHAEGTAYMGSFDTPEQLHAQSVFFGSDATILALNQGPDDPDTVILEWNAMFVGGWDRLVFDGDSHPSLYLGETKLSGDFFVDASVWGQNTDASLILMLNLSEVDESVLSLSEWGLSFEDVTLDELAGGLGVLPLMGFGWIAAEGFSFDREDTTEVLRERIVVAIDEAWIASLLEN